MASRLAESCLPPNPWARRPHAARALSFRSRFDSSKLGTTASLLPKLGKRIMQGRGNIVLSPCLCASRRCSSLANRPEPPC
eukprot:5735995-Amphidinium_carterae.1